MKSHIKVDKSGISEEEDNDKENNLWKITKVSGNTTVTVSASASE